MKLSLSLIVSASLLSVCTLVGGIPSASAQETKPAPAPTAPTTPKTDTPAPAAEPAKDAAQPAKPDSPAQTADKKDPSMDKFLYVKVSTSMGDFFLELNNEKAPISVKNFLNYVDQKFYDGTIFHRVIGNFMVQGGGFTADMKEKKTEKPIKNEWQNGLKNIRGAVSMARTPVADSATSQFFINVVDNGFLDTPRDGAAYAVFARVITGLDVVDKIKGVKTGVKSGHQDVPLQPVTINSVTRCTADEATKGSTGK